MPTTINSVKTKNVSLECSMIVSIYETIYRLTFDDVLTKPYARIVASLTHAHKTVLRRRYCRTIKIA